MSVRVGWSVRVGCAMAGVVALVALAACSDSGSGPASGAGTSAAPGISAAPGSPAARSPAPTAVPTAPVWGFTRVDAATAPVNQPQHAPAAGTAGSWRAGGGPAAGAASPVVVVRGATGRYRVTFPEIGVPGGRGVALVTALRTPSAASTPAGSSAVGSPAVGSPAGGSAPAAGAGDAVVSCHVVGWSAAGTGEQVDVGCRDAAGAPADSAFTTLFSYVPVGSASSVSPGGAYAYLRMDAPGSATSRPANAYRVGGADPIEVHRVGAGHYTIDLVGPAFATKGNNLLVNAVGDTAAGCNALGRVVGRDRVSVFVGCAVGGTWTDTPFALLYTQAHALIPTGATSFGHAFTGISRDGGPTQQPPIGAPVNAWAWYSANSAGATNQVRRLAVGSYQVTFPGVSRTPDSVQVTPYGEPTARCAAAQEAPIMAAASGGTTGAPTAGPAVTIQVRCVDATGRPADSYVSVAYASAPAPAA